MECTQADDPELAEGVCVYGTDGVRCAFDDRSRKEAIRYLGLQDLSNGDRFNAQATLECANEPKSSWSPSFCAPDNRPL